MKTEMRDGAGKINEAFTMYNVTADDSTVVTATIIWKFTANISILHKDG